MPQPEVRVAFTPDAALAAIEEMGYPVVLKPAVGSWGRLLAKVNDRDAAEALLEHKTILGSYHHSIFYIHRYIEKSGRDIRSFRRRRRVHRGHLPRVRSLDHQHGPGRPHQQLPADPELADISLRGARAVGGGIVALDIFETPDGYLVNEVNYTMEFKNSIAPTGVNIPQKDRRLRAARPREVSP